MHLRSECLGPRCGHRRRRLLRQPRRDCQRQLGLLPACSPLGYPRRRRRPRHPHRPGRRPRRLRGHLPQPGW